MKSQKGITLVSLAIYLVAVTIIVGVVASITAFFYSNAEEINEATSAMGQYNIFNLTMLKEVKQAGNSIVSITSDQTRILFKSRKYLYIPR